MTSSTLYTRLQTLIDQELRKKAISSAFLGVQSADGRIDFKGAAGITDPDTHTPVTPNTPYFIASITKLYTASVSARCSIR
ncbi:MAG: serine hydrolase [Chloroflexota bacterium]|nr:serine hydrolase [Chloroflexota bacterium]